RGDKGSLLLLLVQISLTEAVRFPAHGAPVPPSEVLYNTPVLLAPGYLHHVASTHADIQDRFLNAAIQQYREEFREARPPSAFFCIPATLHVPSQGSPESSDLLNRVEALRARGGSVLVFREQELYAMTALVNRYTKEPVRFG